MTREEYRQLIMFSGMVNVRGQRRNRTVPYNRIYLNTHELFPGESQKFRNHSPDGFDWGYGGSGPSQLALAVMLEYIKDPAVALKLYQQFKTDAISVLPHGDFDCQWDLSRWFEKNINPAWLEE